MIKKAALKATVGTAAASLLFLPGATMVASPSVELMACAYPDSINTVTQVDLERPVQRKGQDNTAFVQVNADRSSATGKVKLTIAKKVKRGYRTVATRNKQLNGNERAKFNIPTLNKGTYRVRAAFDGTCRFRNSSDVAFLTVKPRR